MSKTVIVGLTGPTGAGKSAARSIFEEYGFRFVDCDILARKAVEPGAPALALLAEAFGADVIRDDGSLDRSLLASRAFPTAEGREQLNSIVHPAVITLAQEIIEECRTAGTVGVAIDAPLLFESGMNNICDAVIAVTAPDELRLQRIIVRDGITPEAARLRMAAQHECEYYSDRADYTIVNNGTRDELQQQIRSVLDQILTKGGCR